MFFVYALMSEAKYHVLLEDLDEEIAAVRNSLEVRQRKAEVINNELGNKIKTCRSELMSKLDELDVSFISVGCNC